MSKEVSDPHLRDTDLIASLQSLVDCLKQRVEELEAENTKLSSRLSSCRCYEVVDSNRTTIKNSAEKIPGYNTRTMNRHCKRYVALKIMYFGQSVLLHVNFHHYHNYYVRRIHTLHHDSGIRK
jgi:hypothetical protein